MSTEPVDLLLREVNRRLGTDYEVRRHFHARVNSGALLIGGADGEGLPGAEVRARRAIRRRGLCPHDEASRRSGRVSRARAGAVGTRAATQRDAVPVHCAAEHLARGDHLWFCIYADDDCRGRLWRHLLGVAEPATIAFYAAHVIIGFVSGSIAHTHERIDRRLDAAHRAVADLAELGLPIDVP